MTTPEIGRKRRAVDPETQQERYAASVPGYWRTPGADDEGRKSSREGTETSAPESRRTRRPRLDMRLADGLADDLDGREPEELSIEEQAAYLRGPEFSEEALAEAARQWKERIDREFDASVLAGLPDFGPVIERLPQPEIPGHAIYRPWMDPDDEEGAATARVWADLGYAVRVPGYRPLFAESLAALLREQLRWAKVESRIDTPEGTRWRVRTGLVGPNGRHAVLVTVWLLRPGGRAPELQQAWPEALPALPPSS